MTPFTRSSKCGLNNIDETVAKLVDEGIKLARTTPVKLQSVSTMTTQHPADGPAIVTCLFIAA